MTYAISLLFPFAHSGRRLAVHAAVESFARADLLERLQGLDGGEFDLAIAIDLDLAGEEELPERLVQLHRVLRAGGEVLLCVTRGSVDRDRLLAQLRRFRVDAGFWAELRCATGVPVPRAGVGPSRGDLAALAQQAGFWVEDLAPGDIGDAEFALRAVKRGKEQLHAN